MREIYIRRTEGLDIAVLEDNQVVEYMPGDVDTTAEAIYLGRVERIVPGMKAAFVNIGQEKNGFLPLTEKNVPDLPKLQVGMNILVQVRKDAQGVKGAFLSRDLNLCGEYIIISPMNHMAAVSSRIKSESKRKKLKELARTITEDNFGMIMRSAAINTSEEIIRSEVAGLQDVWNAIQTAAPTVHVPSVIYQPRSFLDQVLADYHTRGIDRICTNDSSLVSMLEKYASVTVVGDNLFDIARISTEVKRALERKVWLSCGGNLIFDPCEALTVVDVNTAKFTGKTELADTVLKTNLEACREIARQVRLRNLSGIIIVDMIDMLSREHYQAVLDELKKAFAADRIKTVVHGFTSLGLVELTRKRSRPPLRELMNKDIQHVEE